MHWQLWLWKLGSYVIGGVLLAWPVAWGVRRVLALQPARPPRWLAWCIVVAFFAVVGPLISFLPHTLRYPWMAYIYGWLPGILVGLPFCALLPRMGAGLPAYARGALAGAASGVLGGLASAVWLVISGATGAEPGFLAWVGYDSLLAGTTCGAVLGPAAMDWLGLAGAAGKLVKPAQS